MKKKIFWLIFLFCLVTSLFFSGMLFNYFAYLTNMVIPFTVMMLFFTWIFRDVKLNVERKGIIKIKWIFIGILIFAVSSLFFNYPASATDVCITPTENLEITENTTFCQGTYYLNDTDKNGVIRITGSNLILNCNNSILVGNNTELSEGMVINNNNNTIIKNCNFHSYHFGISAEKLINMELNNLTIYDVKIAVTVSNSTNIKLSNIYCENFEDTCVHSLQGGNNNIEIENIIINVTKESISWGIFLTQSENIKISNINITSNWTTYSRRGGLGFGNSSNIEIFNINGINIRDMVATQACWGTEKCGNNYNISIDTLKFSGNYGNWGYGINLQNVTLGIIKNTNISTTDIGMGFYNTNLINITNSKIENNFVGLVFLETNQNNLVYNNLLNNTYNVYFEGTNSNWFNTTKQNGTRIYSNGIEIGGNYWTNSTGNEFSDTCDDVNYDGFCDEIYILTTNNVDYLPLSDKYEKIPSISIILNYTSISFGTVNPNTVLNPAINNYSINISTSGGCNGRVNFEQTYLTNSPYYILNSSMMMNYTLNTTDYPTLFAFDIKRYIDLNYGTIYPKYWLNVSAGQYATTYTGTQTITGSCV